MNKSFFFTHEGERYELKIELIKYKLIFQPSRASVSDVSLKHLGKTEQFDLDRCSGVEVEHGDGTTETDLQTIENLKSIDASLKTIIDLFRLRLTS